MMKRKAMEEKVSVKYVCRLALSTSSLNFFMVFEVAFTSRHPPPPKNHISLDI
jgi:hypothetical protein